MLKCPDTQQNLTYSGTKKKRVLSLEPIFLFMKTAEVVNFGHVAALSDRHSKSLSICLLLDPSLNQVGGIGVFCRVFDVCVYTNYGFSLRTRLTFID